MRLRTVLQLKTRKVILLVALLFLATLAACANADSSTETESDTEDNAEQTTNQDQLFAQLEEEFDAQLGVYAFHTGTDQVVEFNPDEHFAFASTFKVLAGAVLLEQNELKDLEEIITFTEEDLVTHSPVTENHVDSGMTLLEISEAAIRKSDNTAANLMLEAIGGPDELKSALRDIGDDVTNPVRYETELNDFQPGDVRDTSTPRAMAESLEKMALGSYLDGQKLDLLIDWMTGNATGDPLIRAGAPDGWEVADKSGSANYGTRNDIAVVWPTEGEPIVIAIMSRQEKEDAEYQNELIAKASEIALNALK